MTKSTITRERLQEIAEDGFLKHGESKELARMALVAMDSEPQTDDELSNFLWYSQEATCHSDPNYYCEFQRLATPGLIAGIIRELQERRKAAMDSEPVELPLDYLQGHKDGLEWAAQLAEANHPETGDWLYDDPIELAKAIRKGPDMPPSQPALDTKPVAYTDERNLGYIDRGRETAYLWGKQNSEASDVALYRHAQPAPVVPEEMTPEMMRSVQLNSELGAYAASNLSGAYDLFAEFWKEAYRAAMLIGGKP